ncbi:hypothetical protein STRTUCAR8_01751 [Streptomyces turgidiscabies Car8]|uniref:Uncharacterized protein n=1 Tax=Streptomyces turgidiscabies (strain Car8) TaxID=698760 RepID=L7F654_STRT8|nr:hypothetical protein STRTUCAR8_01751 [Streptomyces turgidiscabies Car8]
MMGVLADVQATDDAHVVDVVQAVLPNGIQEVLARASASCAHPRYVGLPPANGRAWCPARR